MEDTRKDLLAAMGFSEKAIAILDNYTNMYKMENPTVFGQHKGSCGDILMLSVIISNDIIKEAAYEYIGCAGLQACASAMTEIVKGKTIQEARTLIVKDILDYLQGIPEQKYECAEISIDTLKKVLDAYHIEQEEV